MTIRMNRGLEKIIEAGHSVTELKEQLALKEEELEIANEKADKVIINSNLS